MQDMIVVLCRHPREAGLVARMLRCREIYCLPLPFDTPAEQVLSHSPKGVILASESDCAETLDSFDFSLLSLDVPVLALGGMAAELCAHFGGSAAPAVCERSFVTLSLAGDALFEEIDSGERMLGGFSELTLPETLTPLASATERVIGFKHQALPLYAMQFPIERNDPDSAQLLYNFAHAVCGAEPVWNDDAIIDHAVEVIRKAAPEGRVLCAVSGGVDSAVCAKLARLAVGDRLVCVFVDTGLFREEEPESVIRAFMETMGLVVAHVDASESFLRVLSGVTNPADKERIASQLMTQVLIKQLNYDPEIRTIVMGTNFNDKLFGFAPAEKEAPMEHITMCEPISALFKDEVRRLATALDLPPFITNRQPFPSSGLALRVMSSLTEEKLRYLRKADAIFTEEIRSGGYDRRLWQYYATLVESPDRPDGYAVCLRATQTAQGGAVAARLPYDLLERTTEKILAEVPGAARVVYDLTPSAHYGELE